MCPHKCHQTTLNVGRYNASNIHYWIIRSRYFFLIRREPGETKLKFKSVKYQLRNLKDPVYPKKPATEKDEAPFDIHRKYTTLMNEPETLKNFGRTLDKAHKLYFGSVVRKAFTFHVFASICIIKLIESCIVKEKMKRKFLIDGTFRVVPRLYYQLLIITVEYRNDVRTFFNNMFLTIRADNIWYPQLTAGRNGDKLWYPMNYLWLRRPVDNEYRKLFHPQGCFIGSDIHPWKIRGFFGKDSEYFSNFAKIRHILKNVSSSQVSSLRAYFRNF